MTWLIPSLALTAGLVAPVASAASPDDDPKGTTRVPVVFSGGHDTDERDKGRPVVLVAAGLGVKPEVFREAFSKVTPAPAGARPTRDQEHQNKRVLLDALGPLGVTNERLDEVSDHYRYNGSRGETWKARPAVAEALIRDGRVIGYEVRDAGAGYSSPPTVTVPDFKEAPAEISLRFGKDLKTNGSIGSISPPKPNPQP